MGERQIYGKGKISSILVALGKQLTYTVIPKHKQNTGKCGFIMNPTGLCAERQNVELASRPCIMFLDRALYSDRISRSPTPVKMYPSKW